MIEQLKYLMAQIWSEAREEIKIPMYDSGQFVCNTDRKKHDNFKSFMQEKGNQLLEETLEKLKSENMRNIDLELIYKKDTGKDRPGEDREITTNNEYVVWLEGVVKSLIEVDPDLIDTLRKKPRSITIKE